MFPILCSVRLSQLRGSGSRAARARLGFCLIRGFALSMRLERDFTHLSNPDGYCQLLVIPKVLPPTASRTSVLTA